MKLSKNVLHEWYYWMKFFLDRFRSFWKSEYFTFWPLYWSESPVKFQLTFIKSIWAYSSFFPSILPIWVKPSFKWFSRNSFEFLGWQLINFLIAISFPSQHWMYIVECKKNLIMATSRLPISRTPVVFPTSSCDGPRM